MVKFIYYNFLIKILFSGPSNILNHSIKHHNFDSLLPTLSPPPNPKAKLGQPHKYFEQTDKD
ncbi:MAG: hypothetical protein A2W91_19580 [Bacteroidetes bacterium GWF2_38_335]|nr:MAG: hypothetical protein A2W91_19580 [Bacteroidetes bacterium GWF2_38_335]OFY79958.1 MAG: hypothetical protein A2281_10980 [Bacteroidetes bacterium RIFOXYA12_FULL_38_20]HBS86417.1 hypothetical protein [Bacteroidales bacterium]